MFLDTKNQVKFFTAINTNLIEKTVFEDSFSKEKNTFLSFFYFSFLHFITISVDYRYLLTEDKFAFLFFHWTIGILNSTNKVQTAWKMKRKIYAYRPQSPHLTAYFRQLYAMFEISNYLLLCSEAYSEPCET